MDSGQKYADHYFSHQWTPISSSMKDHLYLSFRIFGYKLKLDLWKPIHQVILLSELYINQVMELTLSFHVSKIKYKFSLVGFLISLQMIDSAFYIFFVHLPSLLKIYLEVYSQLVGVILVRST